MLRSTQNVVRYASCRILAVHDDVAFQNHLSRVATDAGHLVTALTIVERAVEVASQLVPDAILLNLMMRGLPGRDGRDVLTALKAHPTTQYIPILAYRSNSALFDQRHVLELGAEAVFSDPLDPHALIAKVERVVLRTSSGKFPSSK